MKNKKIGIEQVAPLCHFTDEKTFYKRINSDGGRACLLLVLENMLELLENVRGKDVFQALNILKFSPQEASNRLEKLLLSAIANWEAKNDGARPEESELIVREVKVDSARMLKRLQTAPQGRAHRIRKRSNHVTIIVDSVKN